MSNKTPLHKQAGGIFLGVVAGLMIGLALAVGVALYITKAPSPFIKKDAQTSSLIPLPTNPTTNLGKPLPNGITYSDSSTTPAPLLDQPQIVEVNPGTNTPVTAPASQSKATTPTTTATTPTPAPNPPTVGLTPPPATITQSNTTQNTVSNQTTSSPALNRTTTKKLSDNPNIQYVLQIGAYKSDKDAQHQRANLAFQGIESTMTQKQLNGTTFYRVRVGPFTSAAELSDTRQKLANAGYNSIVIRVSK